MTSKKQYVGRFAPTPSGPLHFGSIIAALASYLEARINNGKWLLRFDDIDTPRVDVSSYDRICQTLESMKLDWDGQAVYQNDSVEKYREEIKNLIDSDLLYKCYCPRRLVKGKAYPGTCRSNRSDNSRQFSYRVKSPVQPVNFDDLIQGKIHQDIATYSGDFIVLRSDNIISYNLASAIDDAQGITHVIRGADLLDITPKQIYLQNLLGLTSPTYGHIPVAINVDGKKLSKQHGAEDALLSHSPAQVLVFALRFLGQNVEEHLMSAGAGEIIEWALENWSISQVPKVESISCEFL